MIEHHLVNLFIYLLAKLLLGCMQGLLEIYMGWGNELQSNWKHSISRDTGGYQLLTSGQTVSLTITQFCFRDGRPPRDLLRKRGSADELPTMPNKFSGRVRREVRCLPRSAHDIQLACSYYGTCSLSSLQWDSVTRLTPSSPMELAGKLLPWFRIRWLGAENLKAFTARQIQLSESRRWKPSETSDTGLTSWKILRGRGKGQSATRYQLVYNYGQIGGEEVSTNCEQTPEANSLVIARFICSHATFDLSIVCRWRTLQYHHFGYNRQGDASCFWLRQWA